MNDSGIVKKIEVALAGLPLATWIRVPFESDLELLEVIKASNVRKWVLTINVAGCVDVCTVEFAAPVKILQ